MKPKLSATMITGTMASPSSPSVRFTALPAPTMTKAPNTRKNQPSGSSQSLKNGKVSDDANGSAPERHDEIARPPARSGPRGPGGSCRRTPAWVCLVTLR